MCIQEKMIWGLLVFNDPVTNGFQNSNFILVVKYPTVLWKKTF